MINSEIEERIRKIGLRLYTPGQRKTPSIFDRRRWKGKVMEWAMRDEAFRTQLLRFVDLFPSLKSDRMVVKLLKEYFSDNSHIPLIVRWGVKGISERGPLPLLAGRIIKTNIRSFARQFIGEENIKKSLKPIETLRKEGFALSVDLLGEIVVSDREATEYKESYLKLLETLPFSVNSWPEDPILDRDDIGILPRLNISLKVSSFYSQLDPIDWDGSINQTKRNLIPILKKAKEVNVSVTFDMEHYYIKGLTIALFKSILEEEGFEQEPLAGIAIQAYLMDSEKDLLELIRWAKDRKRRIIIRLVKGAYWDYEIVVNQKNGWPIPVFKRKEDTDANFERLTRILLENSSFVSPAIATHNIRSISNAIATAESMDIAREAIEFQMLYGMAEPIRKALRDMDYRVRVYMPVGELIPGMAYLVRRLLENTSNESFLRKSFVEKTPFEELIKAPEPQREILLKEDRDIFRNEPPTDFSRESSRERMKEALKRVRDEFNRKYPLYIGGKEIETEAESISFNPSMPDEIVGRVSIAYRKDAEKALNEARLSWNKWRKTLPHKRADYLFKAAEIMRKRRFELSALEVYEVGKTWKEADSDVAEAIDYLEYYGREMIRLGETIRLGNYPGEVNEYLYQPRGIGVIISPWNFPLAIPTGMASAAIVAGNCVILKPSGLSPVTAWKIIEIFREAGLPPGVLQYLPGPGKDIGEHLVSHPDTDFIAFTGSKDVGLRIIELAGRTLPNQRNVKKVIAEMGGKNAIIVDETADLDESVKGILESTLGYQGQKCSACSRVIVIGEVFSELCKRLKEAMESIRIGASDDPGSFMGPVVDKKALKKIHDYIAIGKKEAKFILIRRGKYGSLHTGGYFIDPVIFVDVKPDCRIAQEEIFGPVLSIMKAVDIDEAIAIANNSIYALTGGIFSRSPSNIRKVREELKVGNLYINRRITGALVGIQPFGGIGMSGVGSKAGGPDYLLQFMNAKSICENTLRRGFAPTD